MCTHYHTSRHTAARERVGTGAGLEHAEIVGDPREVSEKEDDNQN